jgi:hypothetical protein
MEMVALPTLFVLRATLARRGEDTPTKMKTEAVQAEELESHTPDPAAET